jgi:hypothetical protein
MHTEVQQLSIRSNSTSMGPPLAASLKPDQVMGFALIAVLISSIIPH